MRVRFDDQVFTWQPRGGISRYVVELVRGLQRDESLGVRPQRDWTWTRNEHAAAAGLGRRVPDRVARQGVLRLANRARLGRPAPVVHHTYYDARYLRRYQGLARVVTVYDMIPELFPEAFPGGNPHLEKHAFVRAADLVLCISQQTADDLRRVYGSVDAPVLVTPLAVGPPFTGAARAAADLPAPYVLFVGDRVGYKNFACLLDAFARVAPAHRDVSLVVVGGGPWREDEQAVIDRAGLAERVHRVRLTDGQLVTAYAGAECFVFPSRYEGFGLPALEAMATGCPVLLSDAGSLPEVGGRAAVYFSPDDSSQLAAALARVLADPEHRLQLRAASRARATAFSWEATVAQTAAGYRSLTAR